MRALPLASDADTTRASSTLFSVIRWPARDTFQRLAVVPDQFCHWPHTVSSRMLMPLGNGGATVKMDNDVVLSIAPSEYGFLFDECTGLGYVSPEGRLTPTAYCTLHEDDTHGPDIEAERTENGARREVIGGSGHWEGASGTPKLNGKFEDGNRGSVDYSMTLKTP